MTDSNIPERNVGEPERRHDGPVEIIDTGVALASADGVGPALDYMASQGVPLATALRVLTGPRYHRRPETQTVRTVLEQISANKRSRSP